MNGNASQPLAPNRQAHIAGVVRMCLSLLDAELLFYGRLDELLTGMVATNLFSTEAATSLHGRMADLKRHRDEMSRDRIRCQQALAAVTRRPPVEVRMSEIEPHLEPGDRDKFRKRRLLVVSRIEGIQKRLRRTEILLASRHILFADLIAAITGQAPSANCYGANGRRESHVPVSFLEAVS